MVQYGGTLTVEQRCQAKLLHISHGGFRSESVRICLPVIFRGNPDYSYQEKAVRAAKARILSQLNTKILKPFLIGWIGHHIFRNINEFFTWS